MKDARLAGCVRVLLLIASSGGFRNSVGDLSEKAASQEVADKDLEVCSEDVYIPTVRAGHVPVGERAAHLVAAGEEGGRGLAHVRARLEGPR